MINVIEIKKIEEYNEIISHGTVIVIFHATWCGPCKVSLPKLEELSEEYTFKDILFYKIDIDKHKKIAREIDTKVIPTIIVYKNGFEFKRMFGIIEKEEMMDRIIAVLDLV